MTLEARGVCIVVHLGFGFVTDYVFRFTCVLLVHCAVGAAVSHTPSRQGALREHNEKQNRGAPYERPHLLQTNIKEVILGLLHLRFIIRELLSE